MAAAKDMVGVCGDARDFIGAAGKSFSSFSSAQLAVFTVGCGVTTSQSTTAFGIDTGEIVANGERVAKCSWRIEPNKICAMVGCGAATPTGGTFSLPIAAARARRIFARCF